MDLVPGKSVVWEARPGLGKNGGESGKVVNYAGVVIDWVDDFHLTLRSEPHGTVETVHRGWLVADCAGEYCTTSDGKCYRESDCRKFLRDRVVCPKCNYEGTRTGYKTHYKTKHAAE